ncbi:MAG: chemotaxis protein CheD [Chlorobi bacterium]|nr:chemotaxis protein CheD [Chlorobiota bacterium]
MIDKEKIKRTIDVYTGEVKGGGKGTILKSNAIGSCVVITVYDPIQKVGALAHVMVPGAAPKGKILQRLRYASNAVKEMIDRMTQLGANTDRMESCLIGGGNVLKREGDTIGMENLASVEKLLREKGIKIRKRSIGGMERRTVMFDIEKGVVYYTVGDSVEMLLWGNDEKRNIEKRNVK